MTWEKQYLDLLTDIYTNGEDRIDRTGTGTRALFAQRIDINLKDGFPAVTTKKLAWKATVSELLWFLEGSTDERRLAEILYGTRDPSKTTIWTANAQADYWKPKAEFEGDCGRIYGKQWRSWNSYNLKSSGEVIEHFDGSTTHFKAKVTVTPIDQIAQAIDKIKNNPTDRRIIVNAYNVGELDQMCLPPCHSFFIFNVSNKRELSCMLTQRSNDAFLGGPLNIASYALLTHMVAHVTGCTVGRLVMDFGDTHIYNDHFEAVEEQLKRSIFPCPKLVLNPNVTDIDSFTMSDISLDNYESHPAIKAKMSV